MSYVGSGKQKVRVWDWRGTSDCKPIEEAVIQVSEQDYFSYIKWNQQDTKEFVTTGPKLVRFWKREEKTLNNYSPFLVKKDSKKENPREFTQTVFIPENQGAQAVTGTKDGNLIVWDVILILEELQNLNNRREIKSINLLSNSYKKYGEKVPGISLLDVYEHMIVVGTTVGTVRFYDFRFRILCWFEDLKLEQINSISFCRFKDDFVPTENLQDELTEEDIDFPDFIVCDSGAKISLLGPSLFTEIEPSKRKGRILLESIQKKILWMTVCSNQRKIALTCSNGTVYEWSFWSPSIVLLKNFREDSHGDEVGNCIEFSPDEKYLIVGTNQGNIFIKRAENQNFNSAPLLVSHKKKGIQCVKIVFSSCSSYFAVSDDYKTVSVFHLGHKYGDKTQPIEWVFKGKMRAHTLDINDLCFGEIQPGKTVTLFSISKDMHLVEY